MLSVKQRRTISETLSSSSNLESLCTLLPARDQIELANWLRKKFRRCMRCGEPLQMSAHPTRTRCASCTAVYEKERSAQIYSEKREYFIDHSRRYKAAHREEIRAKNREYKKNNPEIVRNNHRTYRKKHPDRVLAQVKSWQARNPDRVKAHHKAGYNRKIAKLRAEGRLDAWRDERNARHRVWYAANRDEIRARERKIRALRKTRKADTKVILQWPYVTERTSENELLLTINALIPRSIQGDLRGDIGNDVFLAALEDSRLIEVLLNDPTKITRFIRAAKKKNFESQGYSISLDEPRRDGRSWHDVL